METFNIEKLPDYFTFAKEGEVFVFDTETTGCGDSDDIIQLALLHAKDGEVVSSSSAYIRSEVPIDGTEAQSVNDITDEFLDLNGKKPIEVLSAFRLTICEAVDRAGKCLLVAHNLPFDLRMVENAFRRYGLEELPDGVIGCDTLAFVRAMAFPKDILPNNKLGTCMEAFALDGENSHEALADTHACYKSERESLIP